MTDITVKRTVKKVFGKLAAKGQSKEEMEALYDSLSSDIQEEINCCFANKLPELSSDIIGKAVFNADIHPERVKYLISELAGDKTIEVKGSFSNEGAVQSVYSKKMLFDIPAKLSDLRIAVVELQKVKQQFFAKRSDLYKSNMLLLQYSVNKGQKKENIDYDDVKGVILIFLFCKSPDLLAEYETTHYIHRINEQITDTGIKVPALDTVIYVQLDKCLEQFKNHMDGENNRELQQLLCMIADINDEAVKESAKESRFLSEIYNEVGELSKEREVQMTILSEEMEKMLYEEEMAALRKAAKSEGYGDGYGEGYSEGRDKGYSEGRNKGYSEGEDRGGTRHKIKVIVSKLKKNMSIEEIAEMDDEPIEVVQSIVEVAKKYSPEYEVDKILEEYIGSDY